MYAYFYMFFEDFIVGFGKVLSEMYASAFAAQLCTAGD
jgi:hypothetical protein